MSAYSSIMDNDRYTSGIHFSPKSVDGKQMISENEIDNEKISHLNIKKVVLDVAAIYRQDQDLVNGDYKFHGSYSISYKKVIEIILRKSCFFSRGYILRIPIFYYLILYEKVFSHSSFLFHFSRILRYHHDHGKNYHDHPDYQKSPNRIYDTPRNYL